MTALPDNLKSAIDAEAGRLGLARLSQATEDLSKRYRDKQQRQHISEQKKTFMESDAHRYAYAVSRMPATYAVVRRVMAEIRARLPRVSYESLLDLGAGPGTAMWAASDVFPAISRMTLVERDPHLSAMGKRFAKMSEHPAVKGALWQQADLEGLERPEPHDLIVLSYVIGELSPAAVTALVEKCWASAKKLVVIVEPGTPAGFERIRSARSQLIALGASIAAPCPHENACPMTGGDWCHFAERIERTSQHRMAKGGTMGHEDEKFSYVVASKEAVVHPGARILRHPLKRSGHINFELCTTEGLKRRIVSRKEGDLYKEARKLEWGDLFLNDE